MHKNLSFSTWNIHGITNNVLGDKTKNQDFINNINNLDFIVLNETWCNTNIDVPGFSSFVSDTALPHTNQVCRKSGGIILLAKKKFEKFLSITKKSKNFLWCKISKEILNNENDLFLCGVYIPPEKSAYFEKEIFDELEEDIAFYSSKGNVMILGDFNARTDTCNDFISKDGNQFINDTSENCFQTKQRLSFDHQINNHGKQLINVCKSSDIRILNGRTKGDSLGRATFHGTNGISVVDYVICDQELFQKTNYFIVKPPTYLSDHSQIVTWIDIDQIADKPDTSSCNIELTKLPNQFTWDDYSKKKFRQTLKSTEIQKKIDEFVNLDFTNDQNGVNECVQKFQNILLETSRKSLKIKKNRHRQKITNNAQKKWFDKDCRVKRHHLKKLANLKHKDPNNIQLRQKYHDALKSYKKTLEMKRNEFRNNKIDELEKASQNDYNLFWKILKNSSDDIDNDKNNGNSPKQNEWFSHFKKLHCEHQLYEEQEQIIRTLKQNETLKNRSNELDTEITADEIIKAANKLKTKKAAYSDRITNEMLKASADILAIGFTKTFNAIMNSGNFPSSWCEGLISPIFKSGNKLDANNYRGICVSSSLGKFFCSILNNRLMHFSKSKNLLHPSQIGFIPGNRTSDHIFTLKTLHDKYINQNNEKIFACFVDFKKAFDSVWHEGLYLKLLESGVGGRFYDLIKDLYSNTRCAVKVSDHRTPFFSYNRGVRQGCVLSPLLFNLYINEIPNLFEKINSDPFLLPNGTKLNSLLYADDLVILSRSKSGLQNCLNSLNVWSNKWLMNINLKKTKVMILQKHNSKSQKQLDFFLGDKRIEITNQYTYLGLKLTPNTKFSIATQQLSEKAMHALFKIRKHLDFHKLTPKHAMKIFDGIVSPILLYNSEVWGAYTNNDFTKWDKTSTEKAHLKFCKLYLGVNRKASNIASRGELGKFPLLIPILKRIFLYIKHINELPDSSIAKQTSYISKRLYLHGKSSFHLNAANIIKNIYPNIDETVDIENFVQDNNVSHFVKLIKDKYTLFWKNQIKNSTKLSFYSTFKKDYNLEEYLNIIKDPNRRRLFSKFRISNHKLEIELGRYKNTPRNERFCKCCDKSAVEDEFHFSFECQKYETLRQNSHNILKEYFTIDITRDSRRTLLSNIMSINDPVIMDLFSKHIAKCFVTRDISP